MTDPQAAPPLVELHDATVVLGDSKVLDSLTLSIRSGRHTAILGPNGAGKSTLMKLLALELYPLPAANGTPPLRLFGRERWEVLALRRRMGIVSADVHDRFVHGNANGSIPALDSVVSGFFATQGVFGHQTVTADMRARAAAALDRVGVAHLASTPLDRVSTGEARRVLIARALVHAPQLLILDEPTRGLDLVARHDFMERVRAIAAADTTLLLVTHYLDEIVPEIDRVVLLDGGHITADGSKRDVLTPARLGPLFGARLTVDVHDGYYHARVAR